jgi:hypothetical protein
MALVMGGRFSNERHTAGRIRYLCYRAVSECRRDISEVKRKNLEAILTELRDLLRLRRAQLHEIAAMLASLGSGRETRDQGAGIDKRRGPRNQA